MDAPLTLAAVEVAVAVEEVRTGPFCSFHPWLQLKNNHKTNSAF